MKLWKVTRTDIVSYDEYDSAVVAAETNEEARNIHPGNTSGQEPSWYLETTWTQDLNTLRVDLLADRYDGPAGVILASYNAG